MEDFVYLNALYDCYGGLLTKRQADYFVSYYEENLSFGEIADKFQVSRNAVYGQLKIALHKLQEYEEKLGFYEKLCELDGVVKENCRLELKDKILNIIWK